QEAVDHAALRVGKHAEVDAEPDEREQIHRLAGAEYVAVLQDAKGATDLVEDLVGIGLQQLLPGVQLMLDDRVQHAAEAFDDALLGLAERGLVGNLENAAAGI